MLKKIKNSSQIKIWDNIGDFLYIIYIDTFISCRYT